MLNMTHSFLDQNTPPQSIALALKELYKAAYYGKLETVNQLLENPEVRAYAGKKNKAIYFAAKMGHFNIVNRLLDIPAVTENVAIHDNRAFRSSAHIGHLAILNRLLEIPEVIENAVAYDNEALRVAARHGHLAMVNRLLEIPLVAKHAAARDNYALCSAVRKGRSEIVNRLLEIPVVAEHAADDNNYALYCAARRGHLAIVNRLLEIPAVALNAHATNNAALRFATAYGHLEIVNRLLKLDSVREHLAENREFFLEIFSTILDYINIKVPFANGYYGPERLREPHDYEIEMINALREIATLNNIPLSDFSEEQIEALKFTTGTSKSLLSNLFARLEEPSELKPTHQPQHLFNHALQFSSGAASSQATCSDDLSPERDKENAKKSHCP